MVSLWNTASAQNLDRRISLNLEDKTIKKAIQKISREPEIRFSYSPDALRIDRRITCRFENETLRVVLDEVFYKNGIQWMAVGGNIVLKPIPKAPAEPTAAADRPNYTISGYVMDKTTGDALIGANVYLAGSNQGVATNSFGFYSLSLPGGKRDVCFSFLGYATDTVLVNLTQDVELNRNLQEASLGIREVIITASRKDNVSGLEMLSDFNFSGRELTRMPGFAGEMDVLKALQTLPGVRSFGDGSSLFYVRGGNHDQNQLMIDGATIYNPSHLFGFFSVLSPDAINDMSIYKGDFPAQYGGRASSVIDITAREGNMKRLGFSGNIGPYASSLTLEGPLRKDKVSFLVSGRVSNLNWLTRLMGGDRNTRIYFYDVNAKLKAEISRKDRLFLTFYMGKDAFTRDITSVYSSFGISWDNYAATLRWNHIFNHKVFLNTTFNYSNYRYFLHLAPERRDYWKSAIMNYSLKEDLTWYINPRNTFRAGFHYTRCLSDPGNLYYEDENINSFVTRVPKYYSDEWVFYFGNEQKFGNLNLSYGIRLPVWQNNGPTTVYYFDVNHKVIDTLKVSSNKYYSRFFRAEPRLSASYRIGDHSTFKASFNRASQYMQILSNGTGPFTSLDVWVPAGPNIEPLIADQTTLGYFLKAFSGRMEFSVEGYYKHFSNHIDYAAHANLLYNPLIEGEIRMGEAWSKGVEFLLQKTSGKFSGWLGYTYSSTMVRTPEVNGGKSYPASYDSPHSLSLFLSYNTYKRWAFSANWVYRTGNPYTAPVGFYKYDGYTVPLYGDKNNERLPEYHRLDVSVALRLNRPENRFNHRLILTIYNFYGRANPFSISYNKYQEKEGVFVVPSDLSGNYEMVPTRISVAGFIPSINYQFKF